MLHDAQYETLPGPGGSLWPAPRSPWATAAPGPAAWPFLTPRGEHPLRRHWETPALTRSLPGNEREVWGTTQATSVSSLPPALPTQSPLQGPPSFTNLRNTLKTQPPGSPLTPFPLWLACSEAGPPPSVHAVTPPPRCLTHTGRPNSAMQSSLRGHMLAAGLPAPHPWAGVSAWSQPGGGNRMVA